MRYYGSLAVLGLAFLGCGPFLISRASGTKLIEMVVAALVLDLIVIGIPIYFWQDSRKNYLEAVNDAEQGGYWVYEPLTDEAFERWVEEHRFEHELADDWQPPNGRKRLEPKEFLGKSTPPPIAKLPRTILEQARALRVSAVGIVDADETPGFSRFGGSPTVPRDFSWPTANGIGLAFFGQFDLSQVGDARLPSSGYLYFFEHEGKIARVFYRTGNPVDFKTARVPQGEKKPWRSYKGRPIGFEPIQQYLPSDLPEIVALNLTDEQLRAYEKAESNSRKEDHFLGFAYPVQPFVDMQEECHEVSTGISNAPSDWILLLEVGEDEEIGFMWGDCGTVYFWIRSDDLAARNFENVHVIVQFL